LDALAVTLRSALHDLNLQVEKHTETMKRIASELQQFSEKKTEYTRLVERHNSLVSEAAGLIRQSDQITAQIANLAGLEQEHRKLEQEVSGLDAKKKKLEELRTQKMEFERLVSEQKFADRE